MAEVTRLTTDPDEIRQFVESHDAVPALIYSDDPRELPVPAVIFPSGPSGRGAQEVTWPEFLTALEASGLALRYPVAAPGVRTPAFFELAQREGWVPPSDGQGRP
jgi:hypothetical protein